MYVLCVCGAISVLIYAPYRYTWRHCECINASINTSWHNMNIAEDTQQSVQKIIHGDEKNISSRDKNASRCARCIWPCSKLPYWRPLWDATPIVVHLSTERLNWLCVSPTLSVTPVRHHITSPLTTNIFPTFAQELRPIWDVSTSLSLHCCWIPRVLQPHPSYTH